MSGVSSRGTPPRSALTELLKKPKVPADWGKPYCLWIHDDYVSTLELVLNPELFPDIKVGECVALVKPKNGLRIVILVSSTERGPFKQSSFQISLHKSVAEKFAFEPRRDIFVRALAHDEIPKIGLAFISFRDQYIGRLPMRQVRDALLKTSAFMGKDIDMRNFCVRAKIHSLYEKDTNRILNSGVFVKEKTYAVVFRSETAKVVILIQLAQESFQIDPRSGKLVLETTIDGFLGDLFRKWKVESVLHIVSIVFFYRMEDLCTQESHQDYFSIVCQWSHMTDWSLFLPQLTAEATRIIQASNSDTTRLAKARNGNFLEAVHLALMIFDKHFLDRDLSKTGMSIIVVTPGNGHFIVNQREGYSLCSLAKRKVVDEGIWMQLICLDEPPKHVAPLLEILDFNAKDQSKGKFYEPYWMRCGFYNLKDDIKPEENPSVLVDQKLAESSFSLTSLLCQSEDEGPKPSDIDPFEPWRLQPKHCLICSQKWSALRTPSKKDLEHFLPDWSTLVSPPCLPIRTRLPITRTYLEEKFVLTNEYLVSVNPRSLFLSRGSTVKELKEELTSLRVALGMQELWDPEMLGLGSESSVLSLNHELHIVDIFEDQVRTRRYSRRHGEKRNESLINKERGVPYGAHIKPYGFEDFVWKDFNLSPSNFDEYPWEKVDNMISGNDPREINGGRYWQSRFILIPADEPPRNSLIMATAANEILDDEELRVAGFLKFVEVFQRNALTRPIPNSRGDLYYKAPKSQNKAHKLSSIEALKIQLTTSTCSAYAKQEIFKLEDTSSPYTLGATPPRIFDDDDDNDDDDDGKESEDPNCVLHVESLNSVESPLGHIAVVMQHPLVGLQIKNRRWHWRMYRSVFIGSAAVDWILKFFDDLETREQAVEYGNRLMDEGVWEHVFGTHRFLDGYYYYRFTTAYDIGTLRKSNPRILRTVSSKDDVLEEGEGVRDDTHRVKVSPIIMSRSVMINVDHQKLSSSPRLEWAFLHYDSIHNPKTAFHFRLHWLTCSSRLVDDMIQSWARRALQCGFIMLEASVETPGPLQNSPFDVPLFIPFACAPPDIIQLNEKLGPDLNIEATFFEEEFLRSHGFVLDFESDSKFPHYDDNAHWSTNCKLVWSYQRDRHQLTQYIHCSGVATVQITSEGLLWSSNRLLLASTSNRSIHPSQHAQLSELEQKIRNQVREHCSDFEGISKFWRETLRDLGCRVGIDSILDNIPDALTEGADGVVGSPESLFDRISAVEDLIMKNLLV